ncbi:MAG: DUF3024 domain-containing protein [Caldilineaceae bacterium]|nr:DUF3024 domain-containing protein [Caldilineaceae bacterium]
MAFSESERKEIDDLLRPLCERVPERLRDKLRVEYEIEEHTVTLNERRPVHFDPTRWTTLGIARFRYARTKDEWQLYWQRASGKWQVYGSPSSDLAPLVALVRDDENGAFWG